LQGLWLAVWKNSTPICFLLAGIINAAMLGSGLLMLQYSMYSKLNTIEFITMRIGFSIYCAWLAAANILNVSYILYSSGFQSNQVMWGRIILFVGWVVYAAYSIIERNPMFGLVFIWVLLAIRAN